MRKAFVAAVVTALAIAPVAGAEVGSAAAPSVATVGGQMSQSASASAALQLVVQLRASANVTTGQLQQLLTLLQRLETSQTQLQNVLTQLGNVQNPPAALKQLLSLLHGTVQPTQLQSLVTQLQTLLQGQPTQAQIQQLLANLQTLLQQLQLTPAQLTQVVTLVRQLFTSHAASSQLRQLLRNLFVLVIVNEGTQAGKLTLCHKTGSKKRPYHKITVSSNAVAAHMRHGDLPAVVGVACPSHLVGTTAANTKNGKHGKDHGKKGK